MGHSKFFYAFCFNYYLDAGIFFTESCHFLMGGWVANQTLRSSRYLNGDF